MTCRTEDRYDQQLARFARRAHAHFGRGFVLVDADEVNPIYVTHTSAAPQPLRAAVRQYDPACEAIVVCRVDDADAVELSRVRIESHH